MLSIGDLFMKIIGGVQVCIAVIIMLDYFCHVKKTSHGINNLLDYIYDLVLKVIHYRWTIYQTRNDQGITIMAIWS